MQSYIKTVPSIVTEAMKRLEETISSAADVQHASASPGAIELRVRG
jgi:hypothetical protein